MNNLTGFRTEDFGGEGYRDLLAVCTHELCELENVDILYDEFEESLSDKLQHLKRLYEEGYKECVWVCRTIDDFKKGYIDVFDGSGYSLDDYVFDRYIFAGDTVILSDIEEQGILVAYKNPPLITRGVDISGADIPSAIDEVEESIQETMISL